MSRRPPWTAAEHDLLIALRRQGLSWAAIAERLDRSVATVDAYVTYHNLRRLDGPLSDTYGRQGYDDAGGHGRCWTPQEDQRLLDLRLDGCTYEQIALRLGRTRKATEQRASALGLVGIHGVISQVEEEFASDYLLIVNHDGWRFSIARDSKQEIERIYRSMFPRVLGMSIEPAPPGTRRTEDD